MQSMSSISFHQAPKLDRYFERTTTTLMRDGWAEQIERLVLFGKGSRPCRSCGGRRRRLPNGEWQEVGGCGFVALTKRGKEAAPDARYRTAWQQWADRALGIRPMLGERLCRACNGCGWVPRERPPRSKPLTARPTGSSKTGTGSAGDVALADPSGHVTAWLFALHQLEDKYPPQVRSSLVIEVYFGSNRSRLHLWPLTPSGRRLLEQAPERDEQGYELHPLNWLDNERAAARRDPHYPNARLINAAELQATELLEQAAKAWNSIVPAHEDEQVERDFRKAVGL